MGEKSNKASQNAGQVVDGPTNPMVTPLLTDLYQFTMAYAYWKAGKHNERAVFDLYFRKNPFAGEFTVFAGLEECIKLIANFKLTEEEISFIHQSLPGSCEEGFLHYLREIDCSDVEVYAISEGTVVFPKVPLLRLEGPVAVVQLLETPVLNLVNFASLVATNAARHRLVAGKSKMLLEFGLRRAQGPDGAIGASKYCYIGGFDATSNAAAGRLFGIPLRGTHSHAFVSSFMGHDEILERTLCSSDGSSTCEDFVALVQSWLRKIQSTFADMCHNKMTNFKGSSVIIHNFDSMRNAEELIYAIPTSHELDGQSFVSHTSEFILCTSLTVVLDPDWLSSSLNHTPEICAGGMADEAFITLRLLKSLGGTFGDTNQSELAAFISYALAFPNNFLALVDTYDVMRSGVPNFCAVALALDDLGYKAVGIRLDSGDLAYLSCEARKIFHIIEKEFGVPDFGKTAITASNDLNEETLDGLKKQGHEVDCFGIGTYLVTCYAQAALGCVFKLVEINNKPRIKLSEDVSKVSIPCKKRCYRLYGKEGYSLVDIMTGENEPCPKVGERILCRHPFSESTRAYVVPKRVEELLKCYWPGKSGKERQELPALKDIREYCIRQLEQMRPDHIRRLNPTPYKVSVSANLYDFIHFLWLNEAPVGELH